MDHVVGISWPRSGHHLLVRLLTLIFGDSFTYCDTYAQKPDCCGGTPCQQRHRVNFTKNHDFQLDVPQIQGLKYLVQYRRFTDSVVSNFELHVLNGGEDSPAGFRRFASKEFDRYQDFLDKWVLSDFARRQFLLDYDTLVADPAATLARVIPYFAPDTEAYADRIEWAISVVDGEKVEQAKLIRNPGAGVHARRDVRAFRFHDDKLFDILEKLALRASEVNETFLRLLKRPANPDNMLGFQSFPSIEALERHIRNSEEYRQIHS